MKLVFTNQPEKYSGLMPYRKLHQFFTLILVFLLYSPLNLAAQSCGGDIITSGSTSLGNPSALDPNGDGGIANTATGQFTNGTSEFGEFESLTGASFCTDCEVAWTRMASLDDEPNDDLNGSGGCGATDIINDDNNTEDDHAYYTIFSGDDNSCDFDDMFIAFRIRIAKESSGNFSFSILVSNDGAMLGDEVLDQFGTPTGGTESFQCCGSGKAMNVGFEKEIQLQTGGGPATRGVYVFDVDNSIGLDKNPDYFSQQNSSAQLSEACGSDLDCTNTPQFYTFIVPLNELGFVSCDIVKTQLALAAVSGQSGNSIINKCTATSDIGGVEDDNATACTTLPCELPTTDPCPSGCDIKIGQNLLCAANVSVSLPVELINFKAIVKEEEVHLGWQTASEINNLGFEIERSSNAQDWAKLSFIAGEGTTDYLQHYSFIDERPMFSGINYYRLRQIDTDGRFEYSPVVVAQLNGLLHSYLQVYPNPSDGAFTLSLQNPNLKKASIKLFDSTGSMIWENDFRGEDIQSFWKKEFILPQHEVYFVVTQVGDQVETKKISVIKRN